MVVGPLLIQEVLWVLEVLEKDSRVLRKDSRRPVEAFLDELVRVRPMPPGSSIDRFRMAGKNEGQVRVGRPPEEEALARAS